MIIHLRKENGPFAYSDVRSLKEAGKSSWPDAKASFTKVATVLGRNHLARDISPDDVLGVLRRIYERGKAIADHVRSYVRVPRGF
jgi:hypothetical protein